MHERRRIQRLALPSRTHRLRKPAQLVVDGRKHVVDRVVPVILSGRLRLAVLVRAHGFLQLE